MPTNGSVLRADSAALRKSPEPVLRGPVDPDDALNAVEDVGELVTLALARADLTQKEAALTMGISDAQFTRQLQGKEHLSLRRLWALPDSFWREWVIVVARRRRVARMREQLVMVMR